MDNHALASDPFAPGLRRLLPVYGVNATARLQRLSVSENWIYLAEDADQKLVLRVHRRGYHNAAEIDSELQWLIALHATSTIPTAEPLRAQNGAFLQRVTMPDGPRWVVAFSFVSGQELTFDEQLSDKFFALGGLTAKLHRHARTWERPSGFTRKRWDADAMLGPTSIWGHWSKAFDGRRERSVVSEAAGCVQAKLDAYGYAAHRFGLIHGDLRLANVLADPERIAVIDFDDCGFGWFAYDFAAAVSFYEERAELPMLQRAWIAGYRQFEPFAADDEAILPTMIMARRLVLTGWLADRSETDTAKHFADGFAQTTLNLAEHYLDR